MNIASDIEKGCSFAEIHGEMHWMFLFLSSIFSRTAKLDYTRTMYSMSSWTFLQQFNFTNFLSCENRGNRLLAKIIWLTVFDYIHLP